MDRFEVAFTADLTDSKPRIVTVRGVELGLFRVDGGYRAYRNLCPHAGAPVCAGLITGGTLRCPWHGWDFDLATGAHLGNPAIALTAYPVEVEGDRLFVLA